MRIIFAICMVFGLLSFMLPAGQNDIEYKHKSLRKSLQKAGGIDLSAMEELVLPDSVIAARRIKGKYFLIKESNVSHYRYIYVGRVNSCRAGGCDVASENPHNSTSEYFDYFILYNVAKTVQKVSVFNYQATHGHEITARGWLKQFMGYDGAEPLMVDKNIDAISGATSSVYAITADVIMKTEILQNDL